MEPALVVARSIVVIGLLLWPAIAGAASVSGTPVAGAALGGSAYAGYSSEQSSFDGVAPPDWTSYFSGIWLMEELSGSRYDATGHGNTLTENSLSTIGTDTSLNAEGTYSAYFLDANDDYLSCADATCSGLSIAGDLTIGCWHDVLGWSGIPTLIDHLVTVTGYAMRWDAAGVADSIQCVIGDGADLATLHSPSNGVNTIWGMRHLACVYDSTAQRLRAVVDGFEPPCTTNADCDGTGAVCESSTCVGVQESLVDPNTAFHVGSTATTGVEGYLDECFVIDRAMDRAELCRAASCNIDGALCTCDLSNPSNYKSCSTNADCRGGSHMEALCTGGACKGINAATRTASAFAEPSTLNCVGGTGDGRPCGVDSDCPGGGLCQPCTLSDPCNKVEPAPTTTTTVTTIPTTTTTGWNGVAPPDWTSATAGFWELEEAAGNDRLDSSGNGNTLTEHGTGGIARNSTYVWQGTYSADINSSTDTDYLICYDATCTTLSIAGELTYGCSVRAATGGTVMRHLSGNNGYMLERDDANARLRCLVGDGTQQHSSYSATSSWPTGTMTHAACRSTTTGTQPFINGASSGTASSHGSLIDPFASFLISWSSAGYGIDGQYDACFVINQAMTDTELCRVYSCRWAGELCTCNATTPANYLSCTTDADCRNGTHNAALCNGGICRGRSGCTLSDACNKAVP